MEQKKTLWIIAAVGAFLLVVLGIAWFNYIPSNFDAPAYAKVEKNNTSDNRVTKNDGWEKDEQLVPISAIKNDKVNEVVVYSDNATVISKNNNSNEVTTIDLNNLKNEILSEQKKDNQITVNVTLAEPGKKNESVVKVPEEKPVQTKVQKVEAKPVQKAVTKNTNNSVNNTKTVASETKKITQYWVQVAAYSNKKAAESARTVLDDNKIPADIFTFKDNKDKMFYRVRVGPYTTKSEAEYWRSKIVGIKDFSNSESFVTSTTK